MGTVLALHANDLGLISTFVRKQRKLEKSSKSGKGEEINREEKGRQPESQGFKLTGHVALSKVAQLL